ncbi:Potassium channel KAT4 [Dissostichus eleginoides]|uniref:Potassium channel KAT4 n=1 Tax=Dissostichus eleginoides TaxID=100907 RepID=A0AAD9BNC7_DISEL|nr:Potassium channel KAT4 [Dissostichus eleginoides]
MSADDFQTKYSSVMESMLKAAIAETTKLFETMVDELKVEISKMKTENEELKTRCWQFEIERNRRTVFIVSGESEPPPGPSDGSEKRDQAIQCDIVPSRIMLVEQCPPVNHQEIENTLHDHNYEGTTQMAFIVVKQEDSYDSKSHSVVKQEEVEQMVVCGQVSGDQPDSPQASACATVIGGRLANQESSTGEIPTPQEETPIALEQPCLGSNSGLQGAQNQLPELVPSIVFSLASINNNIEEDSEDAMLLVEAMNQSTVDMAAPAKTQSASHVGILQTVDEVAAEQQTPPLPVETFVAAQKKSILPDSLTAGLLLGTPLKASVPQTTVDAASMAEKPKGIQEKASLSSEGRTPSEVSTPDFENSTLAPNTTPTENKSSADIMHLTPIATEDMSTPHSWMTKAQFLAQLAVTPVTKDPTKASSEDSMDATASSEDTITGDLDNLELVLDPRGLLVIHRSVLRGLRLLESPLL